MVQVLVDTRAVDCEILGFLSEKYSPIIICSLTFDKPLISIFMIKCKERWTECFCAIKNACRYLQYFWSWHGFHGHWFMGLFGYAKYPSNLCPAKFYTTNQGGKQHFGNTMTVWLILRVATFYLRPSYTVHCYIMH